MKKLSFLFALAIVIGSCSGNSQPQLKRYDVKSGILKYKTTISGNVMGGTVAGNGTSELYFRDWGALELRDETSTQTTTIKMFGKENVNTSDTHTVNKLDNGESYTVDFKNNAIYVKRDPMMDYMEQTETDAGEAGKNMLESMGGKKVGNETYQGHNCEVWEIPGGKQWIYKGVMLKMEMTVLGIKTVTEATSMKFDVSVPDLNFELPDFPIQETENFMNNDEFHNNPNEMIEGMDAMQNLSFEEWKKMVFEGDPEMKNTSDEELRQSYDMMQKMLKSVKGN